MKHTRMNKLVSLILALALIVGAVAGMSLTASAEEEVTASIEYANVEYGDMLHLAFQITVNGETAGQVGIAVYADTAAAASDYISASFTKKTDNGGVEYYATQGIAAKDIDTVYYISVVEKTAEGVVELSERTEYSIAGYVESRLGDGNATDAQKTLYNAILAYGEAADGVLEVQ